MSHSSKGTKLELSVSGAFVTVGGLMKTDEPAPKPTFYEGATLDQDDEWLRKNPTGFKEGGSVSGELLVGDTGQAAFSALLAANPVVESTFRIANTAANISTSFKGYLEEFKRTHTLGDAIKASYNISVNEVL